MLFKDGALFLKTVCRGRTAVRKLGKILQFVLVFLLMDIYIDIGLFCNLQCVLKFKTMTACYSESSYKLIEVS